MLETLIAMANANRVVKVEGPNGSGKSTLLDSYQMHLAQQGVGFGVFSPHESVFEELTGLELYSIAGLGTARQWLKELEGESAVGKRLSVMSSGEKSKVLLALAMCAEIVVLDEPLAHLDQKSRVKFEKLVALSGSRFVIANHESGAFDWATQLQLSGFE